MNLYMVKNPIGTWDKYSMLLVSAETEEEAREIHPYYGIKEADKYDIRNIMDINEEWPKDSSKLIVEFVGTTDREKGIIHKSYTEG